MVRREFIKQELCEELRAPLSPLGAGRAVLPATLPVIRGDDLLRWSSQARADPSGSRGGLGVRAASAACRRGA